MTPTPAPEPGFKGSAAYVEDHARRAGFSNGDNVTVGLALPVWKIREIGRALMEADEASDSGPYFAHVRGCDRCVERWGAEATRAHIEAVLDRVTER